LLAIDVNAVVGDLGSEAAVVFDGDAGEVGEAEVGFAEFVVLADEAIDLAATNPSSSRYL
jgi:hypothetical protein